MQRFRTTFFLVSSLFLLLVGCSTSSVVKQVRHVSLQEQPVWTESLRSDEQMNRYQVSIKVKDNTITGICLLKKVEDGWRGSMINEMGARAFDFTVTEKKATLVNTISMMDKWYIRNTIAADLHFLFEADNPHVAFQRKTTRYVEDENLVVRLKNKKSITRMADGSIVMENLKRNIVYSLVEIEE